MKSISVTITIANRDGFYEGRATASVNGEAAMPLGSKRSRDLSEVRRAIDAMAERALDVGVGEFETAKQDVMEAA